MELEMKARCRMTGTLERSSMNDLTPGTESPKVTQERALRLEYSA